MRKQILLVAMGAVGAFLAVQSMALPYQGAKAAVAMLEQKVELACKAPAGTGTMLWNKLDPQHKPQLTKTDWMADFNAIDANHDGMISVKELGKFDTTGGVALLTAKVQWLKGGMMKKDWMNIFNSIDTNHDGKISRTELQNYIAKICK